MGELYDGCLREELRTTEGGAVEAADIGSVEGIMLGVIDIRRSSRSSSFEA